MTTLASDGRYFSLSTDPMAMGCYLLVIIFCLMMRSTTHTLVISTDLG